MTKKNLYTNIIAGVIVVLTATNGYLEKISEGGDINWITLAGGVLTAVIAWYTGRDNK